MEHVIMQYFHTLPYIILLFLFYLFCLNALLKYKKMQMHVSY